MKKLILLAGALAITFASCGDKKKEEVKKEIETVKEEVKVEEPVTTADTQGDQSPGEKLFADKTCTSCHAVDTKLVGPSIKDIAAKYAEANGNIVKFLKGNADAIVDTDPGQVAIMKGNLETIVKDISPEDLQAIAAYIRSVK